MGQAGFSPSVAMRDRTYAAVAVTFFLLALGMAAGKAILLGQRFDLVVSDGRFYYAYLPSVVIDGDLDLTNQISEHWGQTFARSSWRIGPRRAWCGTCIRSVWR